MIFSLFSGGNLADIVASVLLSFPIILLALSAHEAAHGFVTWKCGDNTAYLAGRLTLNPLKHLDPLGFLSMLIFGFGWAKPVPINTRYFRKPKRDMALTAIAGPAVNLIFGCISALLFGVCIAWRSYLIIAEPETFLFNISHWLTLLTYFGAYINFLYAVFNLLPVPPFDGSRIALAFLPTKVYFGIMRYERQIMYGILIAMLILSYFGFSPFGFLAERLTNLLSVPLANALWEGVFLPKLIA